MSDYGTILATLPGNNTNTIRVYGDTSVLRVTEKFGDPSSESNQHERRAFPYSGSCESFRVTFRQAMAFATELALVGCEDDE